VFSMVLFLVAWAFLSGGAQTEPSGNPDRQVFAVLLPAISRDGVASYVVEANPLPVPQPSDSDWEWFGSATRHGNERLERLQTVVVGHEHDNGHRQRLQVLLELDVLVGSQ
jgi:hypothetical protein